jgi:hypothetical protein
MGADGACAKEAREKALKSNSKLLFMACELFLGIGRFIFLLILIVLLLDYFLMVYNRTFILDFHKVYSRLQRGYIYL